MATETRHVIEMLWMDRAAGPRARRHPGFASIERARREGDTDIAAPALPGQEVKSADARDVFLLLARADAVEATGVGRTADAAIREHGQFVPPLAVVAGDLLLSFDELAALRVMATVAAPFAVADDGLRGAVDAARRFLDGGALVAPPAVVESLMTRLRDAFGRGKRGMPATYLDAQTERALVEQRHHRRRSFDGGPHLRAELAHRGGLETDARALVYLPAAAEDCLPLQARFAARLLVEIVPIGDDYEASPLALKTLALARTREIG